MLRWWKVLSVLFVLPVFATVFFHFAPQIENNKIVGQMLKDVEAADLPAEKKTEEKKFVEGMRFDQACLDPSKADLVTEFNTEAICEEFQYFKYAQIASVFLCGLSLLHLLLNLALASASQKSRLSLLSNFRIGWTSATALSLLVLIGQTLLGTYTFYYLTVLTTDRYFPQLLFGFLIGGLWTFFLIAKLIFTKIPIENNEPASESVDKKAAANLWSEVNRIASQLQTSPPDEILLGMSSSFYVTEFPVRHANGVTSGRTLHLSAPLMKLMPKNEILAIIGHELGHFKGEDTTFTQRLSPLLIKADRTMERLAQGGLIAAPAFYAMNSFTFLFEKVINSFHREREFVADAVGASVTSPEITAKALVRYYYQAAAHDAAMGEHLTQKVSVDEALSKFQSELAKEDGFWQNMIEKSTPHPFDTHPPLASRVEKLGHSVEGLRSKVLSQADTTAFEELVSSDGEVLKHASAQYSSMVKETQSRLEVLGPQANTQLLAQHFPPVTIEGNNWILVIAMVVYAFLLMGFPAIFLFQEKIDLLGKLIAAGVMLAGLYFCVGIWRNSFRQSLTLNHEGIFHSSWKEPLKFADVERIQHMSHNGSDSVIFFFKTKRPPLPKHPLLPFARKSATLNLLILKGKQRKNVELIFKYYTRELTNFQS